MTAPPISPSAVMGLSMSLWEISFRTQYDYPFMKISANHPGLPISMWCIWNREMIQVPTRDETVLDEIAKEIRKAGKCIDQWAEAGESRIFMLKCTCATWRSEERRVGKGGRGRWWGDEEKR